MERETEMLGLSARGRDEAEEVLASRGRWRRRNQALEGVRGPRDGFWRLLRIEQHRGAWSSVGRGKVFSF